jgi:hypothetical protein
MHLYVSRSGLPLRIEFDWPVHRSQSGADFFVLHGTVSLANSDGLHALVALQLTVTVREVLPTLDPRDIEAPAINTLRKAVDHKEIEFLKTPKRVPVPFGSRAYDFKRHRWAFGEASDEERSALLLRKVFWLTKTGASRSLIADPVDAQFLDTTPEHLAAIAQALPELTLDGDYAQPSPELMARAAELERQAASALEDLEKKHAFERG